MSADLAVLVGLSLKFFLSPRPVRSGPVDRRLLFSGWSGPFLSSIIEMDSNFANYPFQTTGTFELTLVRALYDFYLIGMQSAPVFKICWSLIRLGLLFQKFRQSVSIDPCLGTASFVEYPQKKSA